MWVREVRWLYVRPTACLKSSRGKFGMEVDPCGFDIIDGFLQKQELEVEL